MLGLYFTLLDSKEDQSKFEKLYDKYHKLMHYVAKEILADDQLAEDAVQDAFFRIAKNFQKVGEINCPQTKNFVVIIVRNTALTILNKKEIADPLENMEELTRADVCLDDNTFDGAERSQLIKEILKLPEIYRYPLYLYGVYDYKMAEIANLLGVSTETVKKRVQRARRVLTDCLKEE